MANQTDNSNLDTIIRDAQRRHGRTRYFRVFAILIIVASALVAYFFASEVKRARIVIVPDAASAGADMSVLGGYALLLNASVWTISNEVEIRVQAKGYQDEVVKISDAAWDRGKIEIVMRALLADIQATSSPGLEDTLWYFNDVLVSRGGNLSKRVEGGSYAISAQHPFFDEAGRSLEVEPGESYELDFVLTPLEGVLTVTSKPDNASVTVDSVNVGTTPLDVKVEGGNRRILVALEGYESRSDTVAVTAESSLIERHYELRRKRTPVSFSLVPKGGTIIFDGQVMPELANAGLQLPLESQHRVRYSKPGYAPADIRFTVRPDMQLPILVELDPIYGHVDILSTPNADIKINGNVVGQTPLRLKLHAVEHTIELKSPEYVTETRTVTPDKDAPQAVVVTMTSEKDHKLATAPATYANSVGVELKLFNKADTIIMGSNRGETGRRANEFVREVRVAKPFYAGIHEVTVEQFQQFSSPETPVSPNRMPVTNIDWKTAAKFCNWLSAREGFSAAYIFDGDTFLGSVPNVDGYRLLTEAEWEWLARKAGRITQTVFAWGDSSTIPANSGNLADESARGVTANFIPNYRDGHPRVAEVGSFSANAAGIHDLAGNVKEWTHDAYSLEVPPRGSVKVDSIDSSAAARRTIKGSSWRSARLSELRAAWRAGSSSSIDDLGFRIGRYLYGGT